MTVLREGAFKKVEHKGVRPWDNPLYWVFEAIEKGSVPCFNRLNT